MVTQTHRHRRLTNPKSLWVNTQFDPKLPCVGLFFLVHQKARNGRTTFWRDSFYLEVFWHKSKVALPFVATRMEERDFRASLRINTGDVVGFVSVAGHARKRVVGLVVSTAARGGDDVLDVESRGRDSLRSTAVFTTRFGALGDKIALCPGDHELGSNCFAF